MRGSVRGADVEPISILIDARAKLSKMKRYNFMREFGVAPEPKIGYPTQSHLNTVVL